MREQILELKRNEGENIKKKNKVLKEKIKTFRQEFKQNNPYHLQTIDADTIESSYSTVDS